MAYGKATDFYKLVLYPDLLKVFISFKSFLMESIGALTYQVMWSASKDNLTFPLFLAISFLLSYCSFSKVLSSILHERSEGTLCLAPGLVET